MEAPGDQRSSAEADGHALLRTPAGRPPVAIVAVDAAEELRRAHERQQRVARLGLLALTNPRSGS